MLMVPDSRPENWCEGVFDLHFMRLLVNTTNKTDSVDNLLLDWINLFDGKDNFKLLLL